MAQRCLFRSCGPFEMRNKCCRRPIRKHKKALPKRGFLSMRFTALLMAVSQVEPVPAGSAK